MSDQLTIRLSEEMNRALEAASTRMRRKRSEIVRLALSQFLNLKTPGDETPESQVRHLIGSLETGIPDLAENHRSYLLESLKHGE
ncbi:MAG TPA: ribbon-helix-helix protein, CopG family [Thermoanaerobaculia bacterium]|nr:ribbon-helix-helix protein, CopG family [Thermoanaerobaculia bacterium]